MSYFDELTKAMTWLGEKSDTVFLGQQMRYPGNALYKTLEGVPLSKRIELGVMEDAQLGISIGMALGGRVPVTIFPRIDFLMCAMNQLVNHLDKYPAHVIIRTCVGSKTPLDPGPQHSGNYFLNLRNLLENVRVYELSNPKVIMPIYKEVYDNGFPSLIVEYADSYGME